MGLSGDTLSGGGKACCVTIADYGMVFALQQERLRHVAKPGNWSLEEMTTARILAVDDDSNHLAALKRILRRSHYEVTVCTNPRQALQIAITNPPDLILLDVCMPCMSGHEFLHRLRRAQSATPGALMTPVIFLSGLATTHHRVSGLNAGAEDYVTKPYDAEELRARVRNQLRRVKHEWSSSHGDDEQTAALETELRNLWTVIQDCETPLHTLDANLELAGLVRQPELRHSLLSQAKKEVRNLVDSLSRFAEGPSKTDQDQSPLDSEPTGRPTVLCVDDEPAVLHALERILRRFGCHVLLAENGQAALELLSREQVEVRSLPGDPRLAAEQPDTESNATDRTHCCEPASPF